MTRIYPEKAVCCETQDVKFMWAKILFCYDVLESEVMILVRTRTVAKVNKF